MAPLSVTHQDPHSAPPEPHHLQVRRTARYYLAGDEPDGPRRELWIALHGYGQLAGRFLRHFAALADGTRLIVAPEALSRFYLDRAGWGAGAGARVGATWMTREDREAEIEDHIHYLDDLADHILDSMPGPPPSVHVVGFSQGVATATRWLARGRTRAEHLIVWAGRIPADVFPLHADHPLQQVRLDIVSGDSDEYATDTVLAEQRALVEGAALTAEWHHFAGGHTIDRATLLAIASGRASDR
jgi:predicted esterase